MSINEKDIIEGEKKYKNILYNMISKTISKLSDIIKQIQKAGEHIDIDTDIPNMGTTFNNKLNEISHEFKRSGISLFIDVDEKRDYIDSSFVGYSIIEDMIFQLSSGIEALSDYNLSIEKATKKRTEKVKELQTLGPIKKMFFRIRSFFVPTTLSTLTSYSEEEIGEVNSNLLKYKKLNKNLWEYNLKNNIVQSLVRTIINRKYHDFTIPILLEETIIPTLKKLKLDDVIPQLQEEISKSREQQASLSKKNLEFTITQSLGVKMSSKTVDNGIKKNEFSETKELDKEYGE